MNGRQSPSARAAAAGEQRRIKRFVAAHLLAVAGLYGAALAVGGGLVSPPMPSPEPQGSSRGGVPARDAPVATPASRETVVNPATRGETAALPGWAQRVEAAAPWDAR